MEKYTYLGRIFFLNIFFLLDLYWPLILICDLFFCIELQKNVFRFQIGVSQTHFFMHELNSLERLLSNALNMTQRKSKILVSFDKFVEAFSKLLKN